MEILRKLWEVGNSALSIARHLGTSADAVTSKAKRMGLPKRASPIVSAAAFAERLSEHGSVETAATELSIPHVRAEKLFLRICAELGPQALG